MAYASFSGDECPEFRCINRVLEENGNRDIQLGSSKLKSIQHSQKEETASSPRRGRFHREPRSIAIIGNIPKAMPVNADESGIRHILAVV
ncbi:hypothetical protein TNCV_2161751 [Trichonephila clavipes]|nr:hypothetical protein TNCV_2161751 [Trichonephila clavipes]